MTAATLPRPQSPQPEAQASSAGRRPGLWAATRVELGKLTSQWALRIVLAGKKADDATVVNLRDIVERARTGDVSAREAFRASYPPAPSSGAS